ncbi:MAG: LptF/LptG family permease [Planctomycetota bacterium]|nr:LptF/LptG family permease [Planctomycetota bacterium]
MKILDKYIAKNFLVGYAIAFCVLIGLRIIIDLFVNLDEFTEHADIGTIAIIKNIFLYYTLNTTLYFRDFAGMIIVVAAAFSLGKLVRHNELVAVMASGVSLKRVIVPILVLSIMLTGVLIVDQELLIPPLSDQLVRGQDALPVQERYEVWFISDKNGSLICAKQFDVKTATLYNPTIITRWMKDKSIVWDVTGRIDAERAAYNQTTGKWDLTGGRFTEKDSKSTARSTEPVINLIMLLVSLPVLVCRDPKLMKSAVMISFATTGACLIFNFVCKMLATEEVIFSRVMPELWAWLPIFIFLPIAFLELDSMKT